MPYIGGTNHSGKRADQLQFLAEGEMNGKAKGTGVHCVGIEDGANESC